MLGISYKNVAFPILFKMLDKAGNSNTIERIALIQGFIDCLVAGREFIGEKWLNFLNRNDIRYFIRIRNNFKIFYPRKQRNITAQHLFHNMKIGELRHYSKIMKVHGEYCYMSGINSLVKGKIDFCIIVSYNKPEHTLEYYTKRWQIETLFRGLKSSGFNIEDTHLIHIERIEKLILLVMIAFVWCYRIGDFIDSEIKKIVIKNHSRRAISVFKYGLDYLAKYLLSSFNKYHLNLVNFLSCT